MGTRVLVAMDRGERGDFLPGAEWQALSDIAGELFVFDTEDADSDALHAALSSRRPEVLVTCWSTPRLLEGRAESVLEHLRYLCHVTGSVRGLVPRVYIESGLIVTNWAGTVGRSVAEAALALVLSCLRQATRWALEIHTEGGWRRSKYEQNLGLFGRRVGIHGFGSVARALVRLLEPFDVTISAYSPAVPDEVYRQYGVEPAGDLRGLFSGSDVVVDAEAVRDATRKTVTEEVLRLMPEDGVFVNVGRGAVVDEAGLTRVAAEGRLRIGLDVYEKEPLPQDSPLRGLKNVTLFPHIGGPTRDRRPDCGRYAVENVRRYSDGEAPTAPISPEAYDLLT